MLDRPGDPGPAPALSRRVRRGRALHDGLSGAVVVSYSFYLVTPGTQALIGSLEYLPFFLLLFWQWRRRGSPH